jgi:hypothetical protein
MEGRLSHQLSFKTCFVSVDLVPSTPRGERQGLEREREREERKRESVVLSELHLLRPPLDCSHF